MFKSFKKIVSVVAALGLLATSYVTVLATPTTLIEWDMSQDTKPELFRNVVNGKVSDPIYVGGKFGKNGADTCVKVDQPLDTPKDGYYVDYHPAALGSPAEGKALYCSADFAFENEGDLPLILVSGNSLNLYVSWLNQSEVPLDTGVIQSIQPKRWYNIGVAVELNGTATGTSNDIAVYLDGKQIGSGKVSTTKVITNMFKSFRLVNKSTKGNTMYIDNMQVKEYPKGEVKSNVIKFAPYNRVTTNGVTIAYESGVYGRESSDIAMKLGATRNDSLVQWQNIDMASSLVAGNRVEFSFDLALSGIYINESGVEETVRDCFVTMYPTNPSNAFISNDNIRQTRGLEFIDGNLIFYGKDTGLTLAPEEWHSYKLVYDIMGSTNAKISLYIDNTQIASDIFKTAYAINSVYFVRFTHGTENPVYLDNIDLQISDFELPTVTATATNQTQDGVNYMTWDAEPENVEAEEITDCGFAFVNTTTLEEAGDTIVWQESTKREDGTFGAAIAQDPNATGSSIYAIPYIAGQGFAKLGTAVRSIFNTIGNE